MYKGMDVSHLSIDEVEYELLARNILFGIDEHESIKRRKLKDQMRKEKELDNVAVIHSPTWRDVTEEISIIKSKLAVIGGLLENPKTDNRQREKLKTRLVHYRVRCYLLSRASRAYKHMKEIQEISMCAITLLQNYFPDTNDEKDKRESKELVQNMNDALKEIRNEIECLNESACAMNLVSEEGQDEASGGIEDTLKAKELELNKSMMKSEAILKRLSEFEKDENANAADLIQHFKNFVIQTSEQEKTRRELEIEQEKRRITEAEENLERKRRLEKLLLTLNSKIQTEPKSMKLEFPTQEHTENEQEPERKELTSVAKPKADLRETETETSESECRSVSSAGKETETRDEKWRGHRAKKSSRNRKKKHFSASHKKKSKRVSSSSDSVGDSSSQSSRSLDSSFESSDSEDRYRSRRRRNGRKHSKKPLKRVPISEWRLKYDGKDSGRRLGEFLKEVKMRSKAEDISDRELYRGAIHLFTGRAKDWLMEGLENRDFRTWSQLKSELKREFLPPDLDFQLEIQATNRRQARGERFVDFFHDMLKIFQSMTRPMSEKRKFEIVWRNLRFDYKNAMTGARIKSLSTLKRYGRIVDENNWASFQRNSDNPVRSRGMQVNEITGSQNPNKSSKSSTKTVKTLKEFSSKPKSEPNETHQGEAKKQEKQNSVWNPMEGSSAGTLQQLVEQYKRPAIGVCYNCKKQGHHYAECADDRRKFCRICGFPGVLTKTCPICAKNEESSA